MPLSENCKATSRMENRNEGSGKAMTEYEIANLRMMAFKHFEGYGHAGEDGKWVPITREQQLKEAEKLFEWATIPADRANLKP